MNTIISNPATGLGERPFEVRFSQPDAEDRAEVEKFVGDIFYQAHGATIKHFKPCMMSLRDQNHKIVAACGFRSAAHEPLYLEAYLDHPIEEVLSKHTGLPIKRSEIVGIGNFSVAEPGMARYLITAINDHLHSTSNQWAVFTAVPVLRNAFIKMNLNPIMLGYADKSRLPLEEQAGWGSYYAQNPQVMAVQRMDRRVNPRNSETAPAPAPHASSAKCKTCGMIFHK